MKNTIKIFLLITIGIINYNCHNQSSTSILKEDCEITLLVDLKAENDRVSFYDLFENVSLLELETREESLIHRIDKALFYNDSIFIMDGRQGTIFLFNSKGKYLDKLSRKGSGPEEYFDLSDFTINPYTNNLELLSAYQGICCYDLNFKFIEKIPLSDQGMLVHNFAVIDSCTRGLFNILRDYHIEIYNICDKTLTGKYFKVPNYLNLPVGGPFLLENRQKGEAVFTQSFSNTIYSISASSFTPSYKWDFGPYNFSINNLQQGLSQSEYESIFHSSSFLNNHVYSFLTNTENEDFYLTQFAFGDKRTVFTVIHEKETAITKKIDLLEEKIAFPYYPLVTEEYIYTFPPDTFTINAYLNEKIKQENGISLERFQEDQNPVILKYKLKKKLF